MLMDENTWNKWKRTFGDFSIRYSILRTDQYEISSVSHIRTYTCYHVLLAATTSTKDYTMEYWVEISGMVKDQVNSYVTIR